MTLVEAVMVALLTSSPFGNIPFAVSPYGKDVQIEFMTTPPTQMVINSEMEVLEVTQGDRECHKMESGETNI